MQENSKLQNARSLEFSFQFYTFLLKFLRSKKYLLLLPTNIKYVNSTDSE